MSTSKDFPLPASADSAPSLPGSAEAGSFSPDAPYPADADTLPATQLVPYGAPEPYRSVRGYRVERVDAVDRVNHKRRTSERWRAVSLDGRFEAYGDDLESAVESLNFARMRRAIETPVPPAFRRVRPANDQEAAE